MVDWKVELPKIKAEAELFDVDWAFIAAIRHTENGGPGREFGILSVSAPSYDLQLKLACQTLSHRLALFPGNPLTRNPFNRVVYTESFIGHFASIWAPLGASNDPTNLNKNWVTNCLTAYQLALSGKFGEAEAAPAAACNCSASTGA